MQNSGCDSRKEGWNGKVSRQAFLQATPAYFSIVHWESLRLWSQSLSSFAARLGPMYVRLWIRDHCFWSLIHVRTMSLCLWLANANYKQRKENKFALLINSCILRVSRNDSISRNIQILVWSHNQHGFWCNAGQYMSWRRIPMEWKI